MRRMDSKKERMERNQGKEEGRKEGERGERNRLT